MAVPGVMQARGQASMQRRQLLQYSGSRNGRGRGDIDRRKLRGSARGIQWIAGSLRYGPVPQNAVHALSEVARNLNIPITPKGVGDAAAIPPVTLH